MVGGSDCPVEAPNPWSGVAVAAGLAGLGPRTAMDLFTRSLTEGMGADFLVIDRGPRTSPEIGATRVVASFRNGQPLVLVDEVPFR